MIPRLLFALPAFPRLAMTRRPSPVADALTMSKPGITGMVLLATAFGYLVGRHAEADWMHLGLVLLGTLLLGAGGNMLNQYLERDVDALMNRTRNRPLPAGRVRPVVALAGGVVLGLGGIAELAVVANLASAAFALLVLVSYVMFYTPLKRISGLNTLVGAIPGAIPPVLGWVAADRPLGPPALALFLILYVWQLPHFLAIAWLYRRDYAAAGMPMLTVTDATGRRARAMVVLYSLLLVPVTLYPSVIGIAGPVYFFGALAVSGLFLCAAALMGVRPSDATARILFRASLFFLPLVFALMLYDAVPVQGLRP
jgi:protoheme IX farnesyltransferase